jgi:hypothetical protein
VLRQLQKLDSRIGLEVPKGRQMIRSDISFAVWLTNTDSTAPLGRIILRIYARVKTPAESCHPFGISPYGVATYPSEKANRRKPFLP